jgi:hypothetical protein
MENEVKRRNIKYLWHFTKVENLDSILLNGLIPRATLEGQVEQISFNDQYRLNGHKDASCFTLSHPNYKMFYSLRQQNLAQDWVVLAIKSEVLWLKDCAFCYENAASNNVTSIPIQQRKGLQAFQRLFEPANNKPNRETLKLPDNYPTNPQAEVLVFDVIEPQYIAGVITPNTAMETMLKIRYPRFEFRYNQGFYSARIDYEYWKNGN